MTKSKDFGLLYKFNYPPYQIISYSNNSFLICGGGGAAKTGIPNKIELFDLSEIDGTNFLDLPDLKINCSFDSKSIAVMSMRRHFNYLITAEGSDLCEYILCDKEQIEGIEVDVENIEGVVRERKGKQIITENSVNANRHELKLHRKVESCFQDAKVEINVIRYGDKAGNLIVVGGSNGSVRVYQRYNDDHPMDLVLQREFREVSVGGQAIMDLDISPCLDEMVTISDNPDGKYARIWSISRGVKITELALMSSPRGKFIKFDVAYRFKHCRYARAFITDGGATRQTFFLYATHQPVVNDKSKPSFMSVWGPLDPIIGTDYQLIDVIDLGSNPTSFGTRSSKMKPTALCTSQCGLMAAVGSGEGAVAVYRLNDQTHKLGLIYNLFKAHSFFVTNLTFLPSSRAFKTGHQFELLSTGVDNMLRYHRCHYTPTYLRLDKLCKLLTLFFVIFLCDRILLFLSVF